MIPLRDTIPARRFPVVNLSIIAVNVLVFFFELVLGPRGLERLLMTYGVVPARFWSMGLWSQWWTLFTSMFLHAGWWHLIANMLTLYIFGDNVEDRLGRLGYLAFYLVCGVAAGLTHLIAYASSGMPTIGASGAIAGVLGAYLFLFPRSRVLTLVPVFFFARLVEIPALIYLGFWFVSQLFNGFLALAAANVMQTGGVAWWAHIGGFLFGLGAAWLFAPRAPRLPPPPEPPFYRGGRDLPWQDENSDYYGRW